jgi:hypothetical protein
MVNKMDSLQKKVEENKAAKKNNYKVKANWGEEEA